MFKKRNYRKRVTKGTKRSVAGKRKSSVSVAVKKYVKRTISATIENKSKQIQIFNTFGSYLQDLAINMFPMLPYAGFMSIANGVGPADRVGNQIRVKKLLLNYTLNPLPQDAVTNISPKPMHIFMMLGYVKAKSGILPVTADVNLLFQNNNTTSPPTGGLFDIITNVNTDYWTIVKSWEHKIGYANQSSVPSVANFNFTNNDYKYNVVRKLNITKHVNKVLKFDDTAVAIQGKNLFLMYYAINCDGTIPAATQLNCQFFGHVQLDYEDA
jgi:hypothetical protein